MVLGTLGGLSCTSSVLVRGLVAHAKPRAMSCASAALDQWPSAFENTILRDLRAEPPGKPTGQSREVRGAHLTKVRPSVSAPEPVLVACAADVAADLGLTPEDCESDSFLRCFAGAPPGEFDCWATAYGASFFGRYGGQRGDGRAISIGVVRGREVQLKGAGRTPYSRQFDGRAVLRSTVREFLASEAMAALRVPTSRALCVVATGERIARAWYADDGRERVVYEPGAVGTRVASSFLRFGQLELYYQRGETDLLIELATHALRREFSHLLVQHPSEPLARSLVRMFAEVCERQARLVAGWLRVGYAQGNMNSDNSALGGFTPDYGPFGFVEAYAPDYCPWTGGAPGYCFANQPQAAAINLARLSDVFAEVVQTVGKADGLPGAEITSMIDELRAAVSSGYVDTFHAAHDDACRAKLGLATWTTETDGAMWTDLMKLLASAGNLGEGVDFTLFFRALTDAEAGTTDAGVLGALRASALDDVDAWPADQREAWAAWSSRFAQRVRADGRPHNERVAEMRTASPKYILRNWMAAEAYDAAASGEYELVRELHRVLRSPYDDQGDDVDARWAQPTPMWARRKAGLAFLS